MALSIHDTWGVMQRAAQADWSNAEVPRAIKTVMRKNLWRQRAIRSGERELRRQGALPPQPVHPDHIPIIVEVEAPYLFHPATEEDLRAIMRRLPPGSLDGFQSIRLCFDRSEAPRDLQARDSFAGTHRKEVLPGVFRSSLCGLYSGRDSVIRLYGCVCDHALSRPVALFLKIHALVTFRA